MPTKGKSFHNTSIFLNTDENFFMEFIDNRFWIKFKKKQFLKNKIVLLRSLNIFGTKNNSVFSQWLSQYFAVN